MMSVESEKPKSAAATAGPCRPRRKAILKKSGGLESELTKDDLFERMDPDWLDGTKTIVFPAIPHPKYAGQLSSLLY